MAKIVRQVKGRAWLSVPHIGLRIALQKYIRYEGLIEDLLQICMCEKQDLDKEQCLCWFMQFKSLFAYDEEHIRNTGFPFIGLFLESW